MGRFARCRAISGVFSLLLCLASALVVTAVASAAPLASADGASGRIGAENAASIAAEDKDNLAISLSIASVEPDADEASSTESVTVAGCAVTALPNDGSTSGNERAPNLRNRFGRSVYLILGSELFAAGIAPGTVISGIGWNFQTAPGLSGSGPLIIYMENTGVTTNGKSTTWNNAITGMTIVHNATTTIPNVTGPFDITFSGGTSFTYTGGGLYIAFDAQYSVGTLSATTIVRCNSTGLIGGLKGAQSNTAAPATVAASDFRPETRLATSVQNDASVDYVISYGAVPRDLVGPQVVQAVVTNNGVNPLSNLPVTLTVTGAGSFTNNQMVSLPACGGQTTVTFAGFTASTLGTDTLTVTVPADDVAVNNSKSVPMAVTVPSYSFKYSGTTATGGGGLTGSTGAFVGKFTTTFATRVTAVSLEFAAASATAYKVAIYADSGSGTPGTQIYVDSVARTVAAAGPVTLAVGPVTVGPGNFFVGIQQTNTTNASLSLDNEVPVRSGKFFGAAPLPVTAWTDFSPGNNFKLNIGVTLNPCAEGPSICADGNPCTNDVCNAASGCVHTMVDCNDNNPCTDDACDPSSGCTHTPRSGPCDDGNSCTVGGTCVNGICVTDPPVDCNDNDRCTVDRCILGASCVVPDNGSGTATLPPAGCDYVSSGMHQVVTGLPPGTTIDLGAIHRDFVCHPGVSNCSFTTTPGTCEQPGGSLGGSKECADSTLVMTLHGTGALAGWDRTLQMPLSFETHVAAHSGTPVQSFATDMFRLFGQIANPGSGDPDFDLLRISAGTSLGLPSSGHTTLTQLPGGQWSVDSCFDIAYRIDFVGSSGGRVGGMSGSTTGTITMCTGAGVRCVHKPAPNCDQDGDGYSACEGDCNDRNASVRPGNGCAVPLVTGPPEFHFVPKAGVGPAYDFMMGRYEVTSLQYACFLNDAHANQDTPRGAFMDFGNQGGNALVKTSGGDLMFNSAHSTIGYDLSAPPGNRFYVLSKPDHPVTGVTWLGAAKYDNWLSIERGCGASAYTEGPYALDWHPVTISTTDWTFRDLDNSERQALADDVLGIRLPMDNLENAGTDHQENPFNEWYKAAAYDPGYPAGTDPSGAAISANHAFFGFGRDPISPRDANFTSSLDPFDNGTTPVYFYDGINIVALPHPPFNPFTRSTRNTFMLDDMSGNVQEWGQDKQGTTGRSTRGGSWNDSASSLAASRRLFNMGVDSENTYTGFRPMAACGNGSAFDSFSRAATVNRKKTASGPIPIEYELFERWIMVQRVRIKCVGDKLGPGDVSIYYWVDDEVSNSDEQAGGAKGAYKIRHSKCAAGCTECEPCEPSVTCPLPRGCRGGEPKPCRWASLNTVLRKDYHVLPVFNLPDEVKVGLVFKDWDLAWNSNIRQVDSYIKGLFDGCTIGSHGPNSPCHITDTPAAMFDDVHGAESGITVLYPKVVAETGTGSQPNNREPITVSESLDCGDLNFHMRNNSCSDEHYFRAYVEFMVKLNDPQGQQTSDAGGDATNAEEDLLTFEYGHVNASELWMRAKVTPALTSGRGLRDLESLPQGEVREFMFPIDTDNDMSTGNPTAPFCGADCRVALRQTSNGQTIQTGSDIQCWCNCEWISTGYKPYDLRVGNQTVSFKVPLRAIGSPGAELSAWVTTWRNGALEDAAPDSPCFDRLPITITADQFCPFVENIDVGDVEGGDPSGSIRVNFSEPMSPITTSDITISPATSVSVELDETGRELTITPDTAFSPGDHVLTLLSSVKDRANPPNSLDGNFDGTCGDPYPIPFCVPDTSLRPAASDGSDKDHFLLGEPVYVVGSGLPSNQTLRIYLAHFTADEPSVGDVLIDRTSDGPTIVPPGTGSFSATSLGQPTAGGVMFLVADLNNNGILDSTDRIFDTCSEVGLAVDYDCNGNGILDAEELDAPSGTGDPLDLNVDGILDACETFSCTPPPSGLEAWWAFDDLYGNTVRDSVGAHSGTLVGQRHAGSGLVQRSLQLTGLEHVVVPDHSALDVGSGDFSIEGWIRLGGNGTETIVDKMDRAPGGNASGYALRVERGELTLELGCGSLPVVLAMEDSGVTDLEDSEWHLIAVSVDRDSPNLSFFYIDGVVSFFDATSGSCDLANNVALYIGRDAVPNPDGHAFVGKIDELELLRRRIAKSELDAILLAARAGKCKSSSRPGEVSPVDSTAPLNWLFQSKTDIGWEGPSDSGSDTFNVYRGEIGGLRLGNYGTCLRTGLTTSSTSDATIPVRDHGFTYLVTGVNAAGEGPMGYDSSGNERVNSSPCP